MNRLFSTVAVLAMMLTADAICVAETISARGVLGENLTAALLVLEGIVGVGIVTWCAVLLRRKYVRDATAIRAGDFAPLRQLRRLLSTVWS